MVAQSLSEEGKHALGVSSRRDEDLLLKAIADNPGESPNKLAARFGWEMGNGKPYRMKVIRAADTLKKQKMICDHRDAWKVTLAGRAELKRLGEVSHENSEQGSEQ